MWKRNADSGLSEESADDAAAANPEGESGVIDFKIRWRMSPLIVRTSMAKMLLT